MWHPFLKHYTNNPVAQGSVNLDIKVLAGFWPTKKIKTKYTNCKYYHSTFPLLNLGLLILCFKIPFLNKRQLCFTPLNFCFRKANFFPQKAYFLQIMTH